MSKKVPFVTKEKAEEIKAQIPTPFHLYDEREIRARARALAAAFSWNPGFKEYFAVKATPNPAIVRILAEEGCGWISFFYLLPDYRGRGWGAQLLGHALWFCETHGRHAVRLHVAEENEHARAFYAHHGFYEVARTPGVRGTLIQLEKPVESRGRV